MYHSVTLVDGDKPPAHIAQHFVELLLSHEFIRVVQSIVPVPDVPEHFVVESSPHRRDREDEGCGSEERQGFGIDHHTTIIIDTEIISKACNHKTL